MDRALLLRNLRGNWSLRLLNEYLFRNFNKLVFDYIDLTNIEYFPPYKPAPIIICSRFREICLSHLLFQNPSSKHLRQNILDNADLKKRASLTIKDYLVVLQLLTKSDSKQIAAFEKYKIPYGKFIHTTLISKYGIKHFSINFFQKLSNFLLYYRFISSYRTHAKLLSRKKYSRLVLVNGRDAVGVGAQLAAYLNNLDIVCLEHGLSGSGLRVYSEWFGNMHHWKVKQLAVENCIKRYQSSFTKDQAQRVFINKFGLNSRHWRGSQNFTSNEFDFSELKSKPYVVFFATSEKEATTCPTGISDQNYFDEYDQTEAIRDVYNSCKLLDLTFVIRLHPNFSGNVQSINEFNYYSSLCLNWKNVVLIPNDNSFNSYQLAEFALANFTFRSTIAAELSLHNVSCYLTAPHTWSYASPGKIKIGGDAITSELIKKKSLKSKNNLDNEGLDWYTLGTYVANFSTELRSLGSTFKDQKKFTYTLKNLPLDTPRFRFVNSRN